MPASGSGDNPQVLALKQHLEALQRQLAGLSGGSTSPLTEATVSPAGKTQAEDGLDGTPATEVELAAAAAAAGIKMETDPKNPPETQPADQKTNPKTAKKIPEVEKLLRAGR